MQPPLTRAGKICVLTAQTPNAKTDVATSRRDGKEKEEQWPTVPLRLSTPRQEGFQVQRQSEWSNSSFTCLDIGGVEGAKKYMNADNREIQLS